MATTERDAVSGQLTTGHEWDGIKELNTPLPKWWVYVFYATILWSIGYWALYPAWPSLTDHTRGLLGYSSRADLATELRDLGASRKPVLDRIAATALEDIKKDHALRDFALASAKPVFAENCAPCHQAGGAGTVGYPALADDEWIWGGSLDEVRHTIAYGVRNANANARQGEMPAFKDALQPDQIASVADYVVALANKGPGDAAAAGKAVYADNCAGCHGETGAGSKDAGAPALDNALWLYKGGRDAVIAQVSAPRHGAMPAWSERLDETTIKMLAVYVHALGGGR